MERLTISLTTELAEAAREAVESRRFASVSEVIRDALRDWLLAEADRAKALGRPRQRARECTDITKLQLAGIITGASFRRITRFAIRGSAQKRVVEAAVTFQPPLQYGMPIEDARFDLQSYLSYQWRQVVKLELFDSVEDPTEWTLVYEADLPGSDTESSSTS